MSTSGVTTFSLNTNQLIEQAFNILGKASEGAAMTARMYEDGRFSLNMMLKTLGTADRLFTRTELGVTLVANTAGYALTSRPGRILSVRRRHTYNGVNTDIPLLELSRQEYYDIPTQTASTPTSWYFDPQTTSGTLYVWPPPSTSVAADNTLRVTYTRRIEDMVSSNDALDMPQEWTEAIVYQLAVRLMLRYPVNDAGIANSIRGMAADLLVRLESWDTEAASIYFQPDDLWAN
jgi:hypothetical protein